MLQRSPEPTVNAPQSPINWERRDVPNAIAELLYKHLKPRVIARQSSQNETALADLLNFMEFTWSCTNRILKSEKTRQKHKKLRRKLADARVSQTGLYKATMCLSRALHAHTNPHGYNAESYAKNKLAEVCRHLNITLP